MLFNALNVTSRSQSDINMLNVAHLFLYIAIEAGPGPGAGRCRMNRIRRQNLNYKQSLEEANAPNKADRDSGRTPRLLPKCSTSECTKYTSKILR